MPLYKLQKEQRKDIEVILAVEGGLVTPNVVLGLLSRIEYLESEIEYLADRINGVYR